MADYAEQNPEGRGRRSNPKDEDHTRDLSPDRAETLEHRGRKPRDGKEDHTREYSPKEEVAQGGENRWHNGQEWRNNAQGQGGYNKKYPNSQGGQNYQQGQNYRRGQNYRQGHNYRQDPNYPQGQNYYPQGQNYYPQGQNYPQHYQGGGHRGKRGWDYGDQSSYRGQKEHYNNRGQRENGEGRQEGYGGRRRRLDYGGNRQNQRNNHGSSQGPSYPSPSKKGRYVSDYDRHYQKKQNRFNYKDEDPVVFLSKKLSFILRHGAEKMGFRMMPGGFLWVDEILRRNEYRDFTEEDIKHIVKTNDKQRFSLADENGRLKIRANQGHSVEVDGLELTPITDSSEAPEVIHGTYLQSWDIIKNQGLNKMGRNHIHFAAGEPGENGVISGMRSSCEVIIKLNMEKAIKDGLKFFRSANNVILSPGDADGFIRPCYFDSAFKRYPRGILSFSSEIKDGPTIPGLSRDMTKKKKKNKKKNKEDTEGEKAKKEKREKSETGEQEVNMEGATSMFSEESIQGADQETEKTLPQTSEERLPSDGGTQDRSSIPGLSRDMAQDDKKNKKKNNGNKNSEAADEAAMKERNLAASQTQENVPDDWDESDKSNNATSPTPNKLLEFTSVDDADCCMSAVEELKSTGPVFVYCHLKGEEVTFVVCVSKSRAYNFKTELLAEGDLREYLNNASSETIKIFNSIADTSQMLFDKYSIMLDGTNVYNIKVAYDYVKDSNLGNFNELPSGFEPEDWGSLAVGPELLEKCQVSLQAYGTLSKWTKNDRDFKISLFEEVNKNIGEDKLKAERQKRKQSNKKTASESTSSPAEAKQGKKKRKGKK